MCRSHVLGKRSDIIVMPPSHSVDEMTISSEECRTELMRITLKAIRPKFVHQIIDD